MDKNRLQVLLKKYMDGTASPDEVKEVDQWYNEESIGGKQWEAEEPEEAAHMRQRVFRNLKVHIRASRQSEYLSRFRVSWLVAATALLFSAAIIGYQLSKTNTTVGAVQQAVVTTPAKNKINRFIKLPDGSVIILRSGSSVKYNYTSALRSVWLTGEAYFDVVHQNHRPFVVNSGNTRTVVLGTAFNIRALKGKPVTVTVVRGKVSVDAGKSHKLAILTPNQQVEINNGQLDFTPHAAEATGITHWTKSDMEFQNLSFRLLADRLSERYNVDIRFANSQLEKCLITGKFQGTESLEKVLQILSETMGTSYQINEKGQVSLTGTGCN